MQFKLSFVFLVAFIAGPILASDVSQAQLGGPFDQVVEIAEAVLLGVGKALGLAVEELAGGLLNVLQALQLLEQGAVKLAEDAVEREIKDVTELIEQLKNQTSGNATAAVLQCIEDNEPLVAAVEDKAINNSLTCVNAAVQNVGNGVLNTIKDIKSVNDEIVAEDKKLEQCKRHLLPFDCIKEVINNVVNLALTLPSKMEADADKAQKQFDELGGVINGCVKDAADVAKKEIVAVYQNIDKCADKN